MSVTQNQLPGSKVELKFTVTPDEAQPFIDQAVEEISKNRSFPGFRPGKVPYEDVKRAVGEMAIWQGAMESIVRTWYVKYSLESNLETIGSPAVAIDQLTPGSEIKFTCTVAIMPQVTKEFTFDKPFVDVKVKPTKEDEVEKAMLELRKMRHEEVITLKPADKNCSVVIDLEMTKDNVLLEGGATNDYKVYLAEDHYIPKFSEMLLGVKKGDEKKFTLPFPADHYQKMYAGKDIDFSVTVKEVYDIKLPEESDEFAKTLGQESIAKLRELLRYNLESEESHRAMQAAEIELLETLVNKSNFNEVPEILIKEEARRMIDELKRDIEARGGRFEDYLSSLKKSADEMRLEMIPQAIKRVQTAVYVKHIAKQKNLNPEEAEIDAELDRLLGLSPDQATREMVASPEYRDYVGTMLRNRKTLEFLKTTGIKDYQKFADQFAKEEAEHKAKHAHEHVHGPDCDHDHE